ncbi:hypothetical protein GEMRC1_011759 [Eukaryota sp. GEM-RC1]
MSEPHFPLLDHVSSTTRWLDVKRRILQVNEELENKRIEVSSKETEFKKLYHDIDKKHEQLQKDFQDVDNIIQQTFKRRTRAELIIKSIHQDISNIEADTTFLAKTLKDLEDEKSVLQGKVNHNHKYKDYLQSVADSADEYGSVDVIRRRYATLKLSHDTLLERSRHCDDEMERVQSELTMLTEEHDGTLLQQTNHINKLQNLLDQFESSIHGTLTALETGKSNVVRSKTRRAELESAVLALDLRVSDSFHHYFNESLYSKIGDDCRCDFLKKLSVVATILTDLSLVLKKVKENS